MVLNAYFYFQLPGGQTGVGEAVPGLPDGREVTVDGQRAVFTSGLSSRHEIQSDPPTPTGARLLAWYIGEIKIERVSNLAESEMTAVAESLVLMEEGKGEGSASSCWLSRVET